MKHWIGALGIVALLAACKPLSFTSGGGDGGRVEPTSSSTSSSSTSRLEPGNGAQDTRVNFASGAQAFIPA